MTRYLLDTSAIRALKASELEHCAKTATLLASPFAFWELATHLAEPGQFDRIKANLMKFRSVVLINEPTAVAGQRVGLKRLLRDAEDVEASDVTYAALAALGESDSIEEFYRCQIRDANGTLRAVGGCVDRIQKMLGEAENDFATFVGDVTKLIRSRQVVLASTTDYHGGTLDLINGWWVQVKENTYGSEEAYHRVVRQGYFFYSYVMHRAIEYAKNAREVPDQNDLEDAKLLLHLSLDDDVTVVTNDLGLLQCVRAGLETLRTVAQEWYSTNVSICDKAEFLNRAGTQP